MPYVIYSECLSDNTEDYVRDEKYRVREFGTHGEALMFAFDHLDNDRNVNTVMYRSPRKRKERSRA